MLEGDRGLSHLDDVGGRALHDVEGVIAARLPVFVLPGGPPEDEGRLLCPAPAMVGGVFSRAGLLSINADLVQFAEMLP